MAAETVASYGTAHSDHYQYRTRRLSETSFTKIMVKPELESSITVALRVIELL